MVVGPYQPETDDWAAIEAAAIKEGKMTVYANSGGIEDLADAWDALYPDIEWDGADTDGIDTKMAGRAGKRECRRGCLVQQRRAHPVWTICSQSMDVVVRPPGCGHPGTDRRIIRLPSHATRPM